jgi:phosphate transport system permease protein
LAFVYGTITTSTIALLIAVPIGIGAAAFLAEIATSHVRRVGAFLVELLAAVPSVVYGFWGITFLRPVMDRFFHALGQPNTASGGGILTAGILLAIMIVPYITAIAFDACRSVPRSQREAALALGATRWQMIRTAVLPYARPAIIAACLLALGRALGETMAVTMVIGNRTAIEWSISAVGDSMASVIANRLNEADSPQVRSALVTLGLILLVITASLNIVGRWLIRRMTRKPAPTSRTIRTTAAPASASQETLGESTEYRLPRSRWNPLADRLMTGVLALCLLLALLPLFLILFHVVRLGVSSISWEFFTETPKPLSTGSPGGLKHAILGSLMIVAMTLAMAVPLGIMTAIFLAESQAYRLAALVRFVTEVLGGVPSIVLGIFAYAVLVVPPFIEVTRPSFSAWAGAFALTIMMVPVVVRSAEEALRMVPSSLRQASFALGANYWQTVVRGSFSRRAGSLERRRL